MNGPYRHSWVQVTEGAAHVMKCLRCDQVRLQTTNRNLPLFGCKGEQVKEGGRGPGKPHM